MDQTTNKLLGGAAGAGGGLLDNMAPDLGTGDIPLFYRVNSSASRTNKICFNDTGTIAILLHDQRFVKYSLSTPWDLNTRTQVQDVARWYHAIDSNNYFIGNFYSAVFKPDGTKCFVATSTYSGGWRYGVTEVALSTAWDLSTWSVTYTFDSTAYSQINDHVKGLDVSEDGTKLHLCTDDHVKEWTLSTAWDLSTQSYSKATNFQPQGLAQLADISWQKPNGNKFYLCNQGYKTNAEIYEFYTPTPFDFSAYTSSFKHPPNTNVNPYNLNEFPNSVTVARNGSKIFYSTEGSGSYSEIVAWLNLSTNYDITSASWSHPSNCLFYELPYLWVGDQVWRTPFLFNGNGTSVMYSMRDIANSGRRKFAVFGLPTPYDLSSWSGAGLTLVDVHNGIVADNGYSQYDFSNIGMCWSHDGSKLILGAKYYSSNFRICTVDVSTPYNIATAQSNTFTASSNITTPTETNIIQINGDGTRIFLTYYSTTHEYSMSPAYDLSSLTYIGTTNVYTYPWCFNSDGTKVIISDYGSKIHEYDLDAPYDITNTTIDRYNPDGESPDPLWYTMGNPHCMVLSPNEDKLFISSNAGGLGIATFSL